MWCWLCCVLQFWLLQFICVHDKNEKTHVARGWGGATGWGRYCSKMQCYHRWIEIELHCSCRMLLWGTDELLHVRWADFPQLRIHRQFREEKLHSRSVQNQAAVESGERQNPSRLSFLLAVMAALCRASPQLSCTLLRCRSCWSPYFIAQVLKSAFLLLPYSCRVRERWQARRKSRCVAQNCVWGGALLVLILFSALSSWGV